MGKFNEYSQKATPEDNDTLMIYDATAKANKLSPFSGIWNWIVEKLTNAVISNLETSNKSVIGALNELNSNSLNGYFHYEKFADIPKRNILCDVRYESASDPEAPDVTMGTYWWNIIQVCLAENRILQIASSAFNQRDVLYFRVKHDNNWYGWYYVIGQEKR